MLVNADESRCVVVSGVALMLALERGDGALKPSGIGEASSGFVPLVAGVVKKELKSLVVDNLMRFRL